MNKARHLLALLLIVSLLVGAGSASAQDDVTLTIWTFGSFFTDFYEGIEADYKEIAPNVSIVVEEIPYGQLYDNLQGAFVAGVGAPDIVDIEQGVISRFLKGRARPGAAERSHRAIRRRLHHGEDWLVCPSGNDLRHRPLPLPGRPLLSA